MERATQRQAIGSRIIIQLADGVMQHVLPWVPPDGPDEPSLSDLRALAERLTMEDPDLGADLTEFLSTLDDQEPVTIVRAVRSVVASASAIRELERRGGPAPPDRPSLLAFWIADRPPEARMAELVRRVASEFQSVASVTAERRVAPMSPVNDAPNPLSAKQGYLDPGPVGVDAKAAWSDGLDGTGIQFGVIDAQAKPVHPDLPTESTEEIEVLGPPLGGCPNHVAQAMGVVVAVDNAVGVVGMAPAVSKVWLVSFGLGDVEQAVCEGVTALATGGRLAKGDVLLIEVASATETAGEYQPVEFTLVAHTAISNAVDAAIVVVEVAGNGGVDLDAAAPEGFVKTGAILVGSSLSTTVHIGANNGPHDDGHRPRWGGGATPVGQSARTNFGSMVDCYAWGENVFTTLACAGVNNLPGYSDPTNTFGGTSAASAIIAGAAILVQEKAKDSGAALSSQEMRDMLSDPTTATHAEKVTDSGVDIAVGVMPDLAAILKKHFSESFIPQPGLDADTDSPSSEGDPADCHTRLDEGLEACSKKWGGARVLCKAIAYIRFWWCRQNR